MNPAALSALLDATVNDITADAVAIGVATGRTTVAELTGAGAHTVLVDLSDVDRAVSVLAG